MQERSLQTRHPHRQLHRQQVAQPYTGDMLKDINVAGNVSWHAESKLVAARSHHRHNHQFELRHRDHHQIEGIWAPPASKVVVCVVAVLFASITAFVGRC